jgi:uncharacterized protein (TIGR03435 family)
LRSVFLLFAGLALHAQSPTFEVASIKPAPPPDPQGMRVRMTGGPGTKEPGRWGCENMPLRDIILFAYDIQPYQLSGPSWIDSERFEIAAKMPEGTTRPELRQMAQNLLAERFRLKAHRDRKEAAAYELVAAKGGPKLTAAAPRDLNAPMPKLDGPLRRGADGFPEFPKGVPMMVSSGGRWKRQAVNESMQSLAEMLGRQVGRPVIDATGLPGKYDFVLNWAAPSAERGARLPAGDGAGNAPAEDLGPSLMTALQEQLGLKLEPKKATIEVLAIDHVEKTPTEN